MYYNLFLSFSFICFFNFICFFFLISFLLLRPPFFGFEFRLVGFLFVLFFFLTVSIRIVKIYLHEKNNNFFNFKLVSAISVFINFFPLSTSGNIFNNWLNIIYYLYIPFLIGIKNFKKNKNS